MNRFGLLVLCDNWVTVDVAIPYELLDDCEMHYWTLNDAYLRFCVQPSTITRIVLIVD